MTIGTKDGSKHTSNPPLDRSEKLILTSMVASVMLLVDSSLSHLRQSSDD